MIGSTWHTDCLTCFGYSPKPDALFRCPRKSCSSLSLDRDDDPFPLPAAPQTSARVGAAHLLRARQLVASSGLEEFYENNKPFVFLPTAVLKPFRID